MASTSASASLSSAAATPSSSKSLSGSQVSLNSSVEVTEVQEELVTVNLKAKVAIGRFATAEDEAEMEEINSEVRGMLAAFRAKLDRLRHLARRQTERAAREMLAKDVESHAGQLAGCEKSFRDANLKCILEINKRNKRELLGETDGGGGGGGGARHRATGKRRLEQRNKDSLVQESGRLTDDLSSVSRMLAAAVERSSQTVEELAQSSGTVGETHDEFKTMGSVIGQGRKLISKYGRRETTDRVLIFFAFAFFWACVLYVLRKRVPLGPLDPLTIIWNAVAVVVSVVMNVLGF